MGMTVKELQESIKDLDPSMEVIICREAEDFRVRAGFIGGWQGEPKDNKDETNTT